MTGFKRSRKSSDIRKLGTLICRIVVDTPMRSKTDSEATQALKCYHVPHSPLAPSFATLQARPLWVARSLPWKGRQSAWAVLAG
jgi:hypothetical protein